MLIKTHKDWEIDSLMPMPRPFDIPGTRFYPFIELTLNCYLFHVDLLPYPPNEEEPALERRFIATDIKQALRLVGDKNVKEFSLSLQTRRCDNENEEYHISTIIEIVQAEDEAGQISYVYICKDGKREIDSPLATTEEELYNKCTIYLDGQKPSSPDNQ